MSSIVVGLLLSVGMSAAGPLAVGAGVFAGVFIAGHVNVDCPLGAFVDEVSEGDPVGLADAASPPCASSTVVGLIVSFGLTATGAPVPVGVTVAGWRNVG